jgi:hypothetical protein
MVVSVNILLNVPPLNEQVVLLILMLVPAIQACEQSWDWFSTSHILNLRPRREKHLPTDDSGVSRR